MENAPRKRFDGTIMIIFFAIFVLALTLLIVSIRLLQQKTGGIGPGSLLVFSLFGLAGSTFALINTAQAPFAPASMEASATLEGVKQTNHLEQIVDVFEQQNRSLEAGKKQQEEQILYLRGQIKELQNTTEDWTERSMEVFRMIERVVNSGAEIDEGYRLAMLKTKNHFAHLVSPMGVQLIEPKEGDSFDDKIHQMIDEDGDQTIPPWTIVDCMEWGYIINGRVEIPAKVVISRRS